MEIIRDGDGTYDELSRLNSELVNLQRELAKKNAELGQQEKTLRIERDFAETLLNTANAIILVLDTQGRLVRINRFLEVLLGYSQENIPNRNWLETCIAPEDQARAQELFHDTLMGVRTTEKSFQTVTKDARQIDIEWHMSILKNSEGESDSVIAIGLDITERRKIEELIHNKQKLESLGLIAGSIAHNFNNLMGGIFGYIDMSIDASKDVTVTRYLSKAVSSLDRVKVLTAQLLTFSKGGGPKQKNTPLIPFVRETVQITLCRLNLPCKFEIANDLLPCSIDKVQMAQVFDNIIINAQEAMPTGGSIDLTVKNVILKNNDHPTLVEGNYAKISIRDYGIGIQKENLSKIFNPFYTTKIMGHGLGLATCNSIVTRHGGAIEVESEPGNGSTFHIYLPSISNTVMSHTIKSEIKNLETSGRFLIMDDEEAIRETTSEMLESLGYSAVCKENGRDTIDFYVAETKENHGFAGIIMDLTIPYGMGGKATVSEIRKLNTEIPIFVASGYSDDPVMTNPAAYGFTTSICKPFRKKELAKMLEKYIKR